jgi:uncharacterized protein YkwD
MLSYLINFVFVLAGVLAFPLGRADEKATAFSDQQYSQYNHTSFARLDAANQRIDLDNIDYDLLNAAIFYATNKQRTAHNRAPFTFLPLLRDAANLQTEQMVKHNFFSHQNPRNAQLRTLRDRITRAGDEGNIMSAGENISEYFLLDYRPDQQFTIRQEGGQTKFYNFRTRQEIEAHTYRSFGEAIVADWMDSPGHRANILNEKFTHLGCGTLRSTRPGEFPKAKATQVFGTPR